MNYRLQKHIQEILLLLKRGLEIFGAIVYNGNMKNKLPRKYRIISRVCRLDAPENLVFPRFVVMHNGDVGIGKMAETLVLSGFSGGLYLSPVRLSTLSTQKQSLSTTQVKPCEIDYKRIKSAQINRFNTK